MQTQKRIEAIETMIAQHHKQVEKHVKGLTEYSKQYQQNAVVTGTHIVHVGGEMRGLETATPHVFEYHTACKIAELCNGDVLPYTVYVGEQLGILLSNIQALNECVCLLRNK